ncbi:ROK family transcriptional regulator [Rhodovulum sp. P5]|uniref:ROK family transcriptional regulator n=1 Tax=Rhodovulum sp. P5 TaxID=1564506 RepID=UPI0009DA4458|nr:ROK family transcriptional regulator [Rhodovulum sp. P5]
MRAHNERLVLTLLRRHGPQPKAQIARTTGLSAQTVSVIMRRLEEDGLLVRGAPMRGRVGQPSVPMALAPDGALFFGLKVGRRSLELVLMDFMGHVRDRRQERHRYPTPDGTVSFARRAVVEIMAALDPALGARLSGMGIALPFQLWDWAEPIGAPQDEMSAWRTRDIRAELEAALGLPVFLQNDASSACGAELVLGTADLPANVLHVFVGYFIGGGVVLNGSLFTGSKGNAGALGSLPVLAADGTRRQLIELASLATLERMLEATGVSAGTLWASPDRWEVDTLILTDWLEGAANGLAQAVAAACAVIDFEMVLIDGWLPPEIRACLVRRTQEAYAGMNRAGLTPVAIAEGTIGPHARSLGAACLALSERFLVDQNVLLRDA